MTPGRRIRWALVASLALNVLVVGAVVGAALAHRGAPGRGGTGGPPEIRAIAGGLDGGDRRALLRALRDDGLLREGRIRIRESRAEIAESLRAEPFDAAAFAAALAARQAVRADLATRGAGALAEVVATLSPAERAALADRLSRR
ncbi:MAG: periplasmic heavy metal sensor [Pseudomonadota bacterium]